MPHCVDDRYPMIPVRETAAGQIRWGCTNPWHPHHPGACPSCGHSGIPASIGAGSGAEARCRKCRNQWSPRTAGEKPATPEPPKPGDQVTPAA